MNGASNTSGEPIIRRLSAVRSSMRWLSRARRVGDAVWPVALCVIVLVLVDVSLPLPAVVRAELAGVVVLLAGRVLLGFIPDRAARRASLERAARLVEERTGLEHNPLVNALQLRPVAGSAAAGDDGAGVLSAALAGRVVERGVDAVRGAEGKTIVSARPAWRAWMRAGGACALVAVLALIAPRLFGTVVPRFVDPFGDHPAYSPTEFAISIDPDRVLAGDDAKIRVELSGEIPESAEIVMLDERGGEASRIAMTPSLAAAAAGGTLEERPRQYEAILNELREPVRFFVRARTGRSASVTIEPIAEPRVTDGALTITPPTYTGWAPVSIRREMLDRSAPDAEPITVLVGSKLELWVSGTIALSGADAEPAGAAVSASGNVVRVSVLAGEAREAGLSLRPLGPSGLKSAEALRASVLVRADEPPTVEVQQPGKPGAELFVLAGTDVPVIAIARDDVGLTLFEARAAVRRAASSAAPEAPAPLPMNSKDGPFAAGMNAYAGAAVVRTGALDAKPGDVIELTIAARDGRGTEFGGAQETVIGPVHLVVLDEEEFQRRFARELDVAAVTEPYLDLVARVRLLSDEAESIARDAKAHEASKADAAESMERLERERELRQRRAMLRAERDAIVERIERRLTLPPAVSFDEQMRDPMERMRQRLGSLVSEGVTQIGREPTALDADRAATAHADAQNEMARPAAELASADALQRHVEDLKSIVTRQKRLCDRLQGMDAADEESRRELAAMQESVRAALERAARGLDEQGKKAALELPEGDEPKAIAQRLTDQRAEVQRALEQLRGAVNTLPQDAAGKRARGEAASAADAGITALYGAAEPVTEALRRMERAPASLTEPGALQSVEPVSGGIEALLRAIEALHLQIDGVESSVPKESVSLRQVGGRDARVRAMSALAMATVGMVQDAPIQTPMTITAPSAEVRRAVNDGLALVRLKLDRLRAESERTALRFRPLLPTMGQSAIELSGKVRESGAEGEMLGARDLLETGDVSSARARAQAALAALEQLYEEAAQSGSKDAAPEQAMDRKLQLTKPSKDKPGEDEQNAPPDEEQQEESKSAPDTLQQLSQNRQAGQSESESRAMQSDEIAPEEGAAEAQNAPERAGEAPSEQQQKPTDTPSDQQGPSEQDAKKAAEEAAGRRARFFNQQLYEPKEDGQDRAAQMADGAGGAETHATSVGESPADRAAAIRRAIERVGGAGASADSAAAYAQVPPAYRSIVGQYFLKIAAEQDGRSPAPTSPSSPPAESPKKEPRP